MLEKRKEKLKLKKQKQMEERVDEFNNFKDQVKFGWKLLTNHCN